MLVRMQWIDRRQVSEEEDVTGRSGWHQEF